MYACVYVCVCLSGGGGVPVAVDSGHTAVNTVRHRREKIKSKTLACETEGFHHLLERQTHQPKNLFSFIHHTFLHTFLTVLHVSLSISGEACGAGYIAAILYMVRQLHSSLSFPGIMTTVIDFSAMCTHGKMPAFHE